MPVKPSPECPPPIFRCRCPASRPPMQRRWRRQHIPVLAGTDCSACHGAAYQTGGFGPATAMSAAKHAFVSGTCDTCHDTGKSFYVGSGTPLQLRPADHLTSADPRMATSDCSVCHETTDWISTAVPAGHMPNPANLSCSQCHTAAPNDYTPATLAPPAHPAHRHRGQLRPVPRGGTRRSPGSTTTRPLMRC